MVEKMKGTIMKNTETAAMAVAETAALANMAAAGAVMATAGAAYTKAMETAEMVVTAARADTEVSQ